MKNILRNKIFIFLAIFFTTSFFVVTNTFAVSGSNVTFNYNNKSYNLSIPTEIDVLKSYTIFAFRYGSYVEVYCLNNDIYNIVHCGYKKNGTTTHRYVEITDINGNVADSTVIIGDYFFYNLSTDTYGPVRKNVDGCHLNLDDFLANDKFDFLYSNKNVYDIGSNEVVFQGAPVTVEQVTIPKIQQAEEIPQAMNKVLAMIIPIGLIVLSIGLLIYLMRLVILRVR